MWVRDFFFARAPRSTLNSTRRSRISSGRKKDRLPGEAVPHREGTQQTNYTQLVSANGRPIRPDAGSRIRPDPAEAASHFLAAASNFRGDATSPAYAARKSASISAISG